MKWLIAENGHEDQYSKFQKRSV